MKADNERRRTKEGKMQKRLVALLVVGVWLFLSGGSAWERTDDGSIRLESPALVALAAEAQAREEGVNFLQQEAGISAYVNVGQEIDLARVRGAFKTVETVSDNYIIGEIALPDLPEEAHPHVYVNKDGWIVAYYSKEEPVSKVMQWIGYGGGAITTTTLEDAVRKIHDVLPLPYKSVKYYDFEYPAANRIMIITETNNEPQVTDPFYLTVPPGARLYEASWSLIHLGGSCGSDSRLDGVRIGYLDGNGILYEELTSRIKVGTRHELTAWNECRNQFTGVAMVLIYQI